MVFKFGTLVISLVIAMSAHAADPDYDSSVFGGTDLTQVCVDLRADAEAAIRAGGKDSADSKTKIANLDSCLSLYRNDNGTANDSDCPTVYNRYVEIKGQFESACSSANIPAGEVPPFIACSRALVKCSCYPASVADNPTCGRYSGEIRSAIGVQKPNLMQAEDVDINALHKALAYCPTVEEKDLETLKAQVKEAKDSLPKMRNEISQKEGQAEEAAANGKSELRRIEDQISENKNNFNKELLEKAKEGNEKYRQAREEVAAMENEVTTMQQNLAELDFKIQDADATYNAAVVSQDMVCYKVGVDYIAAEQLKMSARSNKLGGNTETVKRIGITNRRYWQGVGEKEMARCKLTDVYKKPLEAAAVQKEQAKAMIENQKSNLREKIEKMQSRISMKIGAACSGENVGKQQADGSVAGTDLCVELKQIEQEKDNMKTAFEDKKKSLNNQYADSKDATNKKVARLNKEVGTLKMQVREEENRLANLRAQLAALNAASTGGATATDKESFKMARSKFGEMKNIADTLISACTMPDGTCSKGQTCQAARNFLLAVGVTPTEPDHFELPITEEPGGSRDYSDEAGTGDKGGDKVTPTPGGADGMK